MRVFCRPTFDEPNLQHVWEEVSVILVKLGNLLCEKHRACYGVIKANVTKHPLDLKSESESESGSVVVSFASKTSLLLLSRFRFALARVT